MFFLFLFWKWLARDVWRLTRIYIYIYMYIFFFRGGWLSWVGLWEIEGCLFKKGGKKTVYSSGSWNDCVVFAADDILGRWQRIYQKFLTSLLPYRKQKKKKIEIYTNRRVPRRCFTRLPKPPLSSFKLSFLYEKLLYLIFFFSTGTDRLFPGLDSNKTQNTLYTMASWQDRRHHCLHKTTGLSSRTLANIWWCTVHTEHIHVNYVK